MSRAAATGRRPASDADHSIRPAHPIAPPNPVLGLQASAGNAAVSRAVTGRSGAGLPPGAAAARNLLGPHAAEVRVHTGPGAAAAAGSALAMTHGRDIHVGAGAPALDSPGGRLLLAHEAAHVLQQASPGAAVSGDRAEEQADAAAVAAMAGRAAPRVDAAEGPQFFEAPKHQASLTGAMRNAGFTDAEQEAAYIANWCRDVSQAFVPIARDTIGLNGTLTILQIMSQMKFGRVVSFDELGTYDPVSHIDSPAGQIPADFIAPGEEALSKMAAAGRGAPSPVDPSAYSPEKIANEYKVDDSGVPAYIYKARDYARKEAGLALDKGRTGGGLFHIGNFSHTVEDLFAHSNWVEAAVGMLIKQGTVPLPEDAHGHHEDEKDDARPPVETYAAEVSSVAGGVRPVLMTGTFSSGAAGHDTLISIKAEVQNLLGELNPFDKGSDDKWWALAVEVLQRADESAEVGELGELFADHVGEVLKNLSEIATGATGGLKEKAGSIENETIRNLASGAADLLNRGAHKATELGKEAWEGAIRDAVASAAQSIGENISLVEAALYVKKGVGAIGGAWEALKKAVEKLPDVVKEWLLPKLVKAEEKFKKAVKELVEAVWKKAVDTLVDALEGAVSKIDPAESNVGRKLERMKAEELPKLHATLVRTIKAVAPGEAGDKAIASLPPASDAAALIALASSPAFAATLASLSKADAAALRNAAKSVSEMATRIQQLGKVPEWVKAGASHSQIAKDHADSPFFGAAFAMASAADDKLVKLVMKYWQEHGDTGPAPGLEGSFAKPKEGEEEKKGFWDSLTIDKDAMERDRQKKFLETRELGDRILKEGHAETRPVKALLEAADALWEVQEERPVMGRILGGVIKLARKFESGEALAAAVKTARAELGKTGDAELQKILDKHPAVIAQAQAILSTIEALAISTFGTSGDKDGEHGEHEKPPPPPPRTEIHFDEQIDRINKMRGDKGTRLTPDAAPSGHARAFSKEHDKAGTSALDAKVDAAGGTRETLMAEIDRIMGHPYDTDWWRPVLIPWAKQNAAILAQAIRDRNAGDAHSHAH